MTLEGRFQKELQNFFQALLGPESSFILLSTIYSVNDSIANSEVSIPESEKINSQIHTGAVREKAKFSKIIVDSITPTLESGDWYQKMRSKILHWTLAHSISKEAWKKFFTYQNISSNFPPMSENPRKLHLHSWMERLHITFLCQIVRTTRVNRTS